MKFRYIYFYRLILLIFIISSSRAFSQKWQNMNDSTYNVIVKNRFNKGNIHFGFGGSVRYFYDSPYVISSFGLRTQSGYFIANKTLLSATIDFYRSWLTSDTISGKADYYSIIVGPQLRYYFNPRHRAFFCQMEILGGKEKVQVKNIPEFEVYDQFTYGGSLSLGLSFFARHFELELIGGLKLLSSDYVTNKDFNPYPQFQVNLSYILDR
jgi:hypothetical protein